MEETAAERIAASYPGVVTYFATNLTTRRTFERDADRPVRTASVIKVPIMVEAFRQVSEGGLRWDAMLALDKQTAVEGSGILTDLSDGLRLTLRDCVVLMIVLSDNTATNMVLDALEGGIGAVNARMRAFGLPQTTVFRKAFSPDDPNDPVGRKFGLGRTTAREMATLLIGLARGEIITPEASAEMVDILRRQREKTGITRGLPEQVDTATKSGAVDDLRNDVGLLFPPDGSGTQALAIFCDGQPPSSTYRPDNIGLLTIGRLARALFDDLRE